MFVKKSAVIEMPADTLVSAGGGELGYGGFWARLAALIVDNAILTILGLAMVIGASFAGETAATIAIAVYFLALLLYWPVMECSARQATFGKQLLGIEVTDMNGARVSFVRSLLRNLAKIISSLPLNIGFLLAAFTSRKQALHDIITNCLVVRSGPSHFLRAIVAVVGGLVISIGGAYYYFTAVYLPQASKDMGRQMEHPMKGAGQDFQREMDKAMKQADLEMKREMEKAMKEAQKGAPAIAREPTPAPASAAKAPAPAAKAPPGKVAAVEVRPMTEAELAEFEKKMKEFRRESAKSAVTPPPASAPVPAPKAGASAPAKLAAAAPSAEKPQSARRAEPRMPEELTSFAPPRAPTPSPRYNDVMTAVMYRDQAAVTQLLDMGWWPDRPDSNGVTPLMAAAMNGDSAIAQLLMDRGANPNARAKGGSVLDYAGRSGDAKIIELLRRGGAR